MQISGITRRRRKTPSEQPRRAVAKKQCNRGGVLRCRRKPQSPSQSAPLFRVGCKCRALSVLFLRCERNQAIGLTPGRGTCPAGLSIAYRFDRCEPSLENPLSPDLRYRNQVFCCTECTRNPVPYRKAASAVRNGAFGAITAAASGILSPVVAEGGEWCDGLFSRTNLLAFHKVALNRNDIVPGIQDERY